METLYKVLGKIVVTLLLISAVTYVEYTFYILYMGSKNSLNYLQESMVGILCICGIIPPLFWIRDIWVGKKEDK